MNTAIRFPINRRGFFGGVAATAFLSSSSGSFCLGNTPSKPTEFIHACMTLPYGGYSFERALHGIRTAGFRSVAWGVTHVNEQDLREPVLKEDASLAAAKELANKSRDQGLEPVMMFSTIYPEHADAMDVLTHRILQAEAAGIGQVLTFGHTQGGNRELWVQRFKRLGPIARDHGVVIVIKQHGGSTGTGQACAEIVTEVNDAGISMNYDAGNVMDYLNLDPIEDLRMVSSQVSSFCIKDHRNWPRDEDCGPGFGEIDHYRLFEPVAHLGKSILLAYENISAPLIRAESADEIDRLAKRAREHMQWVITGLQRGIEGSRKTP